MATDSDLQVTKCSQCQANLAQPQLRRPTVNVQLNGQGGVWPAQTLQQGDTLEIAFRKNGGTWAKLPRDYQISVGPQNGNTLVGYVSLKLEETNFGGE